MFGKVVFLAYNHKKHDISGYRGLYLLAETREALQALSLEDDIKHNQHFLPRIPLFNPSWLLFVHYNISRSIRVNLFLTK